MCNSCDYDCCFTYDLCDAGIFMGGYMNLMVMEIKMRRMVGKANGNCYTGLRVIFPFPQTSARLTDKQTATLNASHLLGRSYC